ncbi:unnamed protein product [Effrenium voratum]|uniref:Protein kinase domain-containing protein n=1 Tax=Effrenium voratum TaxID=2562239 RepID=A0AA36J4F6_9DINO|nr:unnamed protein product [Effrenium voratum]
MDHWEVERECRISVHREEESGEDVLLEEGDLLRTVDHAMARIFRDGPARWLHVPLGAQVYRAPDLLPMPRLTRAAYVKLEEAEEVFLRRRKAAETGVMITELSSYGEPWVVEHDQVVVRRGPSTKDPPLGVMQKGDVVGVRRRQGDWVELVQDCEVRFKKREGAEQVAAINPLRRHKAGQARAQAPTEAWMLVEHPSFGQLLRRARKRKGGLSHGCVLSPERHTMYQQVIELCHKRIYKENLDSLWDGEADKLPSVESLEARVYTRFRTFVGDGY